MQDTTTVFSPRFALIAGLVLACALSRLVPHPFNFSPIEATALFAGATFARRWLAIAVPLLAMAVSDVFLGFHDGIPLVYACIALMSLAGGWLLRNRIGVARVAIVGLGAAVFFFVVTNFMVWATGTMYPHTGAGLVACYVAAIPFFHNQIAGVMVYSLILFGGYALLTRRVSPPATP